MKKMVEKYRTSFRLTPEIQEVETRLQEFLSSPATMETNCAAIIGGLQAIDEKGEIELLGKLLNKILETGLVAKGQLAQMLAAFLASEVDNKEPFLCRLEKYL